MDRHIIFMFWSAQYIKDVSSLIYRFNVSPIKIPKRFLCIYLQAYVKIYVKTQRT